MTHRSLALALALFSVCAPAAQAGDMVQAELRPGWRLANGDHVAALHLRLEPGWKTYWRAPGDAGIPPVFNWSGSDNLDGVSVTWPTPHVFLQSGMRSVGYTGELVLPLVTRPAAGGDITLRGEMELGLCKDICLPHRLRFEAVLPAEARKPDPVIAASMASVPFTEAEAGVRGVRCEIAPDARGLRLTAVIDMPSAGGHEETVIEAGNPMIWVSEPETRREGRRLHSSAVLMHMEGKGFAVNRSAVRITVLGQRMAVDVQGCD